MTGRRSCALGAVALVAGWLLTACDDPSGSGQEITLYNGQHVQTTDALVSAFEKATGITVNVRSDDEDTLADEIVAEGSPLARGRHLHRELAGPRVPRRPRGLLAAVDASTLDRHPEPVTTRRRATGWASPRGSAC